MEKVALLVDVQNVYYTTRERYKRHFDYNTFWRHATADREVTLANAYAIDRNDPKQRQFQNVLRGIGFSIRLKPYIQRQDGSAKGDWDVGITIDALAAARDADVIVLVSGDGDFDLLAKTLREDHGKRVEVYGVEALTAQSLIQAASQFFAIDTPLLLETR
ncbi:NYN domain-containing protein [Alteromonas sp. ASW11-19]|uniref:NYN domain-containing protein n=1 Tax=Alteromonas salexigens TaxID=2982530 RepID=A0ABT2VSR4_9ALTE|nr:NYN domain-containing protein [Alteromonas salexigens]MCU7555968.1 NYN domain-containing protein [Alteromonas salexigens]